MATFGPLEIFVNCDHPGCDAEGQVWSGHPETTDHVEERWPQGWTHRGDGTYCPRHSLDGS